MLASMTTLSLCKLKGECSPRVYKCSQHAFVQCIAFANLIQQGICKNEQECVHALTLGILRSEPGFTFIFTFVMAEIGFKTKSQKSGLL